MEFEIRLDRLHFFARHGVFEEEQRIGNEFLVTLSVRIPYEEGVWVDKPSSTISYADLFEIVKEEMECPRKLLETVALKIVHKIFNEYSSRTLHGYVTIEKVRPPVPEMLGSASVTLKF